MQLMFSRMLFILVYARRAIIFMISILAETNRAPFGFTWSRRWIGVGYNVEYSSWVLCVFSCRIYKYDSYEYFINRFVFWCNNIIFYDLCVYRLFFVYLSVVYFTFIYMVRASLPRYRYDHLMSLGGKRYCL